MSAVMDQSVFAMRDNVVVAISYKFFKLTILLSRNPYYHGNGTKFITPIFVGL